MLKRATLDASQIDRQVGESIRARRILLGLTQDQLGEALGISYQQIQKYETGANRVSAGRLAQIADLLETRVGAFFGAADAPLGEDESESSRLIIELVRNFSRIRDGRVRTNVMSLIRSLGDAESTESQAEQSGARAS